MAYKALFPTYIFNGPLKIPSTLKRDLLSVCKKLPAIDEDGLKWSRDNYPSGYTSYSSMANLHLRFPPFIELNKLIDKEVKKFSRKQNWDLQGGDLRMTTCWVNLMPQHSHHSLHLHPLAAVSGTFYLQTPPKSGVFKIEDPRMGLLMAAPPKKASSPANEKPFFVIQPKAEDLVLFESWLRHEVPANTGNGIRISISFNYEWS